MAEFSQARQQAIAALIEIAPDRLLKGIEVTFRPVPGEAAAFVRSTARNARADRTARAMVFAPLLAMCDFREDGVRAETFPRAALAATWTAVAARRPDDVEQIRTFIRDGEPGRATPAMLDTLCLTAALEVRNSDPSALALPDEASALSLSAYLELAPRARSAMDLVDSWTGGQLDAERLKQVRLAFKDAGYIRTDGVPRLMEILFAQLNEGGLILRLLTAVAHRGSAAFAADSEVADFGMRLVDYVEAQAANLGPLARTGEPEDAGLAASGIARSAAILLQFDLAFDKGNPWAERLVQARKRMGSQLEGFSRGVDAKVAKALPMASQTLAGRMSRKVPDLQADPASPAARRALAALIILEGARTFAPLAGCEAARSKAIRLSGERTDRYAEGVLEQLPDLPPENRPNALALLELAASFLDLTQGPEVGGLVRRRMATACIERGEEYAA